MVPKMIHHDVGFFLNGSRVFTNILPQDCLRLAFLNQRVILCHLVEVPISLVGGVILENIKNEALLNGLLHGVEVERFESCLAGSGFPKQLKGLVFGRGGESEHADVFLPLSSVHLLVNHVFIRGFVDDMPVGAQGLTDGRSVFSILR